MLWPGQRQLSFLYGRGGELRSGQDVSPLQIGIVSKDLFEATSGGKLAKDGADRHPGVPDAGKTAHPVRIDRDPLVRHGLTVCQRTYLAEVAPVPESIGQAPSHMHFAADHPSA